MSHFPRSYGVIRIDALERIVREDLGLPPGYRDLAGIDPLQEIALFHLETIGRFFQAFPVGCEVAASALQVIRGRPDGYEGVNRYREDAVPVVVEYRAYLPGNRPQGDDIEIVEVGVGAGPEVLIADIAPTHYGHTVVDDERLVVHSPSQPVGPEGHPEGAGQKQFSDAFRRD